MFRETVAWSVLYLALCGSAGHGYDLLGDLCLLHPHGFLHRDLVERIHTVFHSLRDYACLVTLNPYLQQHTNNEWLYECIVIHKAPELMHGGRD